MKQLSFEEFREVVKSILLRIDEICRANDITYYLYAGTLLGAIRHGGFIPWDDDADIGMKREDYYRLAEIINNERDDLTFICIEHNPDTIYPFGKVCDTRTFLKEKNFKEVQGYGAFVDVFPLDYIPDHPIAKKLCCCYFTLFEKVITHSARTGYTPTSSKMKNLLKQIGLIVGSLFNTSDLVRIINRQLIRVGSKQTGCISIPWASECYPSECFDSTSEVQFDGHMYLAPGDTDGALRCIYGDYMSLPPEDQRIPKHGISCYINDGELENDALHQ